MPLNLIEKEKPESIIPKTVKQIQTLIMYQPPPSPLDYQMMTLTKS